MKKFSVLIVLALLAVAGTGYAVTCAYDNVPAATLLVPYFRVGLNGATGYPIPYGGIDTLVSVTNVSTPGVIAHVTVWNKYSKPVIDFNLPLTGKDVAFFSMRDILNGALSPNDTIQCRPLNPDGSANANYAACIANYPVDPCGLTNPGLVTAGYLPDVGWAQNQFIRFSHPESALAPGTPISKINDIARSISQYNLSTQDAIGSFFRPFVWDSLDESGDVTTFSNSKAGNILDVDNPQCNWSNGTDSVYKDALSGYVTIDVVNFCTNYFPDQPNFYNEDAIATTGWFSQGGYTPNVLMGDVFYIDSAANGGNISGDPTVAVEFDVHLQGTASKTFFGKFVDLIAAPACATEATTGCTTGTPAPAAFVFGGDGREPLGDHYGFRYLADAASGLQSWIMVWRSDEYVNGASLTPNLCAWADPNTGKNKGASGSGLYDALHQVQMTTFDNDENVFKGQGVQPGPSGSDCSVNPNGPGCGSIITYIFLESQRIDLAHASDWNPQGFKGGWVDVTLRGATLTGATKALGFYNQGWVGVQHTAPGAFLSVGHAATNLNNQFQCQPPIFTEVGNQP
jgi:hypothetical protein